MKAIRKLKSKIAFISGISILVIPTGLLLWLLFSWAWKIAVAALIIFVTTIVIYIAADWFERELFKKLQENIAKDMADEACRGWEDLLEKLKKGQKDI